MMLSFCFLLVFIQLSMCSVVKITKTDTTKDVWTLESSVEENNIPDSKDNFDCVLNIDQVYKLQPLMVSPSLTWPTFKINDAGKMIIPGGEKFLLVCPNNFINFPSNKYVTATCAGETKVIVQDKEYDFWDIQCTEEVKHIVKRTNETCLLSENSQKVKLYYDLFEDKTIEVIDLCMDTYWHDAFYSRHVMGTFADVDFETTWADSDKFKMDFNEAYDCKAQTAHISRYLKRPFHPDGDCCYSLRQLVSHRDVFPGVSQRAAFSYLNNSPLWSTCHDENWVDLERKVRSLAKSTSNGLLVWTGAKYDELKKIRFTGAGYTQFVPIYLWKVVQDTGSNSSLAIVQVNLPDLTSADALEHTLCSNICDQIEWMKGSDWSNLTQGYTYCCTIEEFEKAFNYENVFEPHLGSVLVQSRQY